MPQLGRETLDIRGLIDSVAERQFGLVTRQQLLRRGIDDSAIDRARLHLIHRGVYSVAPPSLLQLDARLAAAILRGGEGARLHGLSAAHWAGLRKQQPPKIHIAVTGPKAKVPGIVWHRTSFIAPSRHNRLPMTPLRLLPLECAADLSEWDLKGLLAELEYHHDIGPEEVATKRGVKGSAKLRKAIADHTPQLAETRSELEEACVRYLTDRNLRLPDFNHPVGLSTVDGVYADLRLILELDGVKGHRGERRILRDHRRDLHRRREGFTVLRYAYAQFFIDGDLIEDELRAHGVGSPP